MIVAGNPDSTGTELAILNAEQAQKIRIMAAAISACEVERVALADDIIVSLGSVASSNKPLIHMRQSGPDIPLNVIILAFHIRSVCGIAHISAIKEY